MADAQENTQTQEELKRDQNWAEMESDEDEQNEDIGVQDGQATSTQGETPAAEEGVRKKKQHKRPQEERKEEKKQFGPPQQRSKTNRGDYVVTSFVIPERSLDQVKKVSTHSVPLRFT
jgi:hypothetical protein